MGRKCPICGKGMFREKQLKKHMREHHADHTEYPYLKAYHIGYQSGAEIRRKTKKRKREREAKARKGGRK